MSEQGRPKYFNTDTYLDAVEMMINADEVERALWMLDNMPGYYRDNMPERALEILNTLHKKTWTAIQYSELKQDEPLSLEVADQVVPLRGMLVEQIVRSYNELSITPHIMELAPGGHWLPQYLKYKGLVFTYSSMSLTVGLEIGVEVLGPVMFVCFETIEHLADEADIYRNYLKMGAKADVFMLSTPLYTINGGEDNWRERELGHLRTYTPAEFMRFADKYFKGCKWEMVMGEEMILTGVKNVTPQQSNNHACD